MISRLFPDHLVLSQGKGLNMIIDVARVCLLAGLDDQHHCHHGNSCSISIVCLVYLQRSSLSLPLSATAASSLLPTHHSVPGSETTANIQYLTLN